MPQDANVSSAKLLAHRVSQARAAADPVVAIEAAFLQAEARGTLAQAVRKTVQSNRCKALQAAEGIHDRPAGHGAVAG
jgi:hypothetical protein